MGNVKYVMYITEHAKIRIQQLRAAQGHQGLRLRIYIESGGCSGLQYGFKLERDPNSEDLVLEYVVMDKQSALYLQGVTVDYVTDLKGARFVVNNPNAQKTCSCGTSFALTCDKKSNHES
jgi:iron-sulfur cluster insertion protein